MINPFNLFFPISSFVTCFHGDGWSVYSDPGVHHLGNEKSIRHKGLGGISILQFRKWLAELLVYKYCGCGGHPGWQNATENEQPVCRLPWASQKSFI